MKDRFTRVLKGHIALAMAGLCTTGSAKAATADAASCPPQATAPTRELLLKAQQQAADRGLLWRISRGGRDSFLYGTMHAGRAEWLALGPRTEASLARTGALALEAVPHPAGGTLATISLPLDAPAP